MQWFAVVMLFFLLCSSAWPTERTPGTQGDTTIVSFAYFPQAVPVAVLGEVIKRDRLLGKALHRLNTEIRFQTLAKGNDALPLLRTGQLDGIMFSDLPTIEACYQSKLHIVGIVKQSYSAVVGRKGTMVSDLRGKRIGNAIGSTSHYALMQALATARLTEHDVTIVPMDVNAMPQALAQGGVDAFAAWEPIPTAALSRYPDRFTILFRQKSNSYFVLTQNLVTTHPDVARELAAALVRAIHWLERDRKNLSRASRWTIRTMREFTGKEPSLTEADITRITRNDLIDIPSAPLLPKGAENPGSILAKQFEFLKLVGRLPVGASWETVQRSFNRDLIQQVLANPKRYPLYRFDYAM